MVDWFALHRASLSSNSMNESDKPKLDPKPAEKSELELRADLIAMEFVRNLNNHIPDSQLLEEEKRSDQKKL